MCPDGVKRASTPGVAVNARPKSTRFTWASARSASAIVYSGSAGSCLLVRCRLANSASSSWRWAASGSITFRRSDVPGVQ